MQLAAATSSSTINQQEAHARTARSMACLYSSTFWPTARQLSRHATNARAACA